MKHIKPSLAMMVVIAGIIAFLYWPVEGIMFFVIISAIIFSVLFYRFLYEYFNKK